MRIVRILLFTPILLLGLVAAGSGTHQNSATRHNAGSEFASRTDAKEASADGAGKLLLVLDASGSMAEDAGGGQTRIQAAKDALRTVVDELPDDAEGGLRVYGSDVYSRAEIWRASWRASDERP